MITAHNNLPIAISNILPAMSGSKVTYCASANMYVTSGYTSRAGNTYFQGVQMSDRIVIKYNIGQGYAHTFLNGLQIYGFNGQSTFLIGTRSFYNYWYDNSYHQSLALKEAAQIVADYLRSQMRMRGIEATTDSVHQAAGLIVNGAMTNQKLLC